MHKKLGKVTNRLLIAVFFLLKRHVESICVTLGKNKIGAFRTMLNHLLRNSFLNTFHLKAFKLY